MTSKIVPSTAAGVADIGDGTTIVMMEHLTKAGESKIVPRCTFPVTGLGCADRIFTDLAVIDVTPTGLGVVEMVEGLSFEELERLTAAPLRRIPATP